MPQRILTLTLNPAVDLASRATSVVPTHKVRTTDEHVDPGGGGINVSRVIHALGGETQALVLAGGATGQWLEALLLACGVPHQILPMAGRSRVSLTVYDEAARQEYRFVPEGPEVTPDELAAAEAVLAATPGAWLVLSGSLPRGAPPRTYGLIAAAAAARGVRVVLDTSGPALAAALHRGLVLIKPSLRELEHLVGRPLPDTAAQEGEAARLVATGAAAMVAVTLGADGALLATADGVVRLPALAGLVRSAVGAGDAFLGAMVLSLARGDTPHEALVWGTAAGSAAVENAGTARVTRDAVVAAYRRLRV